MRATIVEVEGAKSEAEMAAIEILLLLLASLFITGHAFLGNNPDCALKDLHCPDLPSSCAEGELRITPVGECCPSCQPIPDCTQVVCNDDLVCPPSMFPITFPNECCPICYQLPRGKRLALTAPDCSVVTCLVPKCPVGTATVVPPGECCAVCADQQGHNCPPACSKEFCGVPANRRAICMNTGPREIPGCTGPCQLTYCHACYFSEEILPRPGACLADCNEGLTSDNPCFKAWATCVHRAHRKTNGTPESYNAEHFICYNPPCPFDGK